MSPIRGPLLAVRSASSFLLTAAAVLAVIVFLFAYPLVSAALALAVPLLMVATVTGFATWMNARTSMWHGRRPFFFGVADWGFLGCFGAFAIYGFANIESSAQMIAYVFAGVLFIAAARFAFMEFEVWWLGLAFSAIMLAITGEYLLFTLPHPEWFFDFVASLFLVASIALIVTGSAASYLRGRSIEATEMAPRFGPPALRGVAIALVVLAGISAVTTLTGRTNVSGAEGIVVEWKEHRIEIERELMPGETQLLLRNNDLTVHTFTVIRLEQVNCIVDRTGQERCETREHKTDFDFTVGPGSERLVTIDIPAEWRYQVECAVPGHNEY